VPKAGKKTCLALTPRNRSATHVALFERMAQALEFELAYPAAGADRAAAILQAGFVLADVSGNDPEVLYSLGVAHTFGKRVFLVTDNIDRLPYDLASSRAWVVDPSTDNRDILRAMAQFLSIPYAIGPVRVFLGKFAFFGEHLIARRFLAFLIDAIWMLLLLSVVLYLVLPAGQPTIMAKVAYFIQQLTAESDNSTQTVLASAVYVVLAYFALSTWLLRATFGQLVTGLRVVQTDYRRATFGQCVGRSVLSLLVIMTYGAGFLSALRGPGYQAVHDVLSGTIVVRSHTF
jgi:uncharacterized RDD family membrane protein YckC